MLLLMSFSILILYGTCTQSFSYEKENIFFSDFVFALNKCLYFVSLSLYNVYKEGYYKHFNPKNFFKTFSYFEELSRVKFYISA